MSKQVLTLTRDQSLVVLQESDLEEDIRSEIQTAYNQATRSGWTFVVLHLRREDAQYIRYLIRQPKV